MTREVVCEPLFLFTKFLRLPLLYIILAKNKTLKYKNPRLELLPHSGAGSKISIYHFLEPQSVVYHSQKL